MSNVPTIDAKTAEDHLMRFLSVDGVTGQEAAIAAAVSDVLKKIGVPASAIRFDDANKRIPVPTQTGNLYADLPGTRSGPHRARRHPSLTPSSQARRAAARASSSRPRWWSAPARSM